LATYLDKIVEYHRERAAQDVRDLDGLISEALGIAASRGFVSALRVESSKRLAVIAEVKRRSPSKGNLNIDLDPADMARRYESAGASCLSVLTDEPHFGGSVSDLRAARAACSLPVLRKDFTVSPRDVCDARIIGADCVLLIAAALEHNELIELHDLALSVGLDVLVEIHDEAELAVAIDAKATLIGVNQRDLVTFKVDHDRAVRMSRAIPASVVRVAESGVRDGVDARSLRDAGYDAVLVGESLVTSGDIDASLGSLRVA
jgi:indole-3-glycerol phosphate synthase